MHGNILTQKFVYFGITPFRNYSKLSDREFLSEAYNLQLKSKNVDEITFLIEALDDSKKIKGNPGKTLDLMPKKHKSRSKAYFTSPTDSWCSVRIEPFFKNFKTFYTTNDKHLKNHYNKPFSEVQTNNVQRTITLTGEYLSIRLNTYTKYRGINSRYFKKNSTVTGLKINLKTGNIITYQTNGRKKNKSSRIRQNCFQHVGEILLRLFDRYKPFYKGDINHENIIKLYDDELNDTVFLKTLYHTISSLLDVKDYVNGAGKDLTQKSIGEMLVALFVKIKNIKVPNNYIEYVTKWYPTQKYLKKNGNKLVAAILDRLNLKTKSFIKLLHDTPNVNIHNLVTLSKMFGYHELNKYVANLDKRYYTTTGGILRAVTPHYSPYEILNKHFQYDLTGGEKSRLVKLLNSVFDGFNETDPTNIIEEQLRQIMDHIIMIDKIREYIPTIELKSQHIKDFHHEHIEYSKIERTIQKGYSIEYTFDKRLVEHVEEVIYSPKGRWFDDEYGQSHYEELPKEEFYPVILKTDGEYSEEGSHMHHCVASYADRELSLIISIRQGDRFGRERVTCEFNTRTKELVQAKYFCNAAPPENFTHALEKVIHRIEIFRGSIQSTGKEKIPLVINGFQIPIKEKKSTFDFLIEQLNDF